jgi:hypothetical protein
MEQRQQNQPAQPKAQEQKRPDSLKQDALNPTVAVPKERVGASQNPVVDVPEGTPGKVNPLLDTLRVDIPTGEQDENGNSKFLSYDAGSQHNLPQEYFDLVNPEGIHYFVELEER